MASLPTGFISSKLPAQRGVAGALLDLELQRVELIRFNLFDNSGSYPQFVEGRDGVSGSALKVWPEMRLTSSNPSYSDVGGDGTQVCKGELIRWRTVTGICNDIVNPAMGSSGMLFARNVELDTSFPDLGLNELTRNRHGNRLSLLEPDPQVISRRLFTRVQSDPTKCQEGYGLPGDSKDANCDYKKAPFFNVLAAYWIQFMTHDWFSHLEEGHNQSQYMKVGCETKLVNNVGAAAHSGRHREIRLPSRRHDRQRLCRPGLGARDIYVWRKDLSRARAKDHAQYQYGVVGRFAALWI